jgi:hypothetical protein
MLVVQRTSTFRAACVVVRTPVDLLRMPDAMSAEVKRVTRARRNASTETRSPNTT